MYPYKELSDKVMQEVVSPAAQTGTSSSSAVQEINLCLFDSPADECSPSCSPTHTGLLILALGLQVGLSLLIQGAMTTVLSNVGLSDSLAGVGNSVYHATSVIAGVSVARSIHTRQDFEAVPRTPLCSPWCCSVC